MRRIVLFSLAGALTALMFIGFACTKSSSDSGAPDNTSGQDSVLLNIGNNIILPGYQSLAAATASMDAAVSDFNANPSSEKLVNLKNLFKDAYLAWQAVSEYNYFGPAKDAQPALTSLNIFPASAVKIDANISAGDYNINTFANTAAKGFPALDYLLFGADNNTLLAAFSTDANAANRQKYLAAVSVDIKAEADAVLQAWLSSGGNYIHTFITGKGNSVSSSLGLLLNSLNQDFEILKNNRLGIPLGKIPVGTTSPVLPDEVEAYYSGISVQLAVAQFKAVQGIYLGTASQGNGLGLDDYLIKAKATYHGGLLNDTIKAVMAKGVANLEVVPSPLSQTLQTDPAPVNTAFTESQRLVTLLKTDMTSALGVLITYGDNDGD